jgi:hypothetical protein
MKQFTLGIAAYLVLAVVALQVYRAWQRPAAVSSPKRTPGEFDPEATDLEPADGPPVALPDLSGVDRSLAPLPAWRDPRYCLLVFGKRQVNTRVWLVEDGDTLYVDRDGSGNLADPAKAFRAVVRDGDNPKSPSRSWIYNVGDLAPDGGREHHSEFRVTRYQLDDGAPAYTIYVRPFGGILQCAGWTSLFAKDCQTAPVIHFGGPVVARALSSTKLSAAAENPDLQLCVGTPGLGEGSFAYVAIEAIPAYVHPVAKIRWPEGSPEAEGRFLMKKRC